MIKVQCDRCQNMMDTTDRIGYLAWNFRKGLDGDLSGENPLEKSQFCGECMDKIMKYIMDSSETEEEPVEAEPEKKEAKKKPKKEKTMSPEVQRRVRGVIKDGGKMYALKEAGWKYSDIADEFGVSLSCVTNWFARHKKEEYS